MNWPPQKILLVEDDEVNLLIAEHLLSKAGYQVSTVDNGERAIEAMESSSFDLVLMDIEMPLMDGLEAARHIRQTDHGQSVPIIALTAHTLPEKLAQIEQAGMNGYLIKPFEIAKFDSVLHEQIG